jgi:hypothetical protein
VFPADCLMLAVGGVGVDNIKVYAAAGASATASARRSTSPAGRRCRSARLPGRWFKPQKLDFLTFLPYIGTSVGLFVRQLSRGRFFAFGAVLSNRETR